MLQKAFFKVDVVDRIYDTPVFEKTTPGNYSFTVPEEYNYVVIEYAGAGGGSSSASGGRGSIMKINKSTIGTRYISGIVGAAGLDAQATLTNTAGAGYANGESGSQHTPGPLKLTNPGGGGSTSLQFNRIVYEASAGGGACSTQGFGGRGGGKYAGSRQTTAFAQGNNATDPGSIGLNPGNGYVKIWAGYDPYFKG